jgi:penicillin amidase
MSKVTIDSLRGLQNDNFNIRARKLLPLLLAQVDSKDKALDELKKWNLQNSAESLGATIFETWMLTLQSFLWDDEFASDEKVPMSRPAMDRTIHLIEHGAEARWWDNVKTKNKKESMHDIISGSFQAALDSLQKRHGSFGPAWAWYKEKETGVRHLIPGMDALSRLHIPVGGGGTIVNATTTRTGPSWRFIVELSKKGAPKAYGIYPGGQSGNPGSSHYDDLIDTWAKGELKPLLYLDQPNQSTNRIRKKLTLSAQ